MVLVLLVTIAQGAAATDDFIVEFNQSSTIEFRNELRESSTGIGTAEVEKAVSQHRQEISSQQERFREIVELRRFNLRPGNSFKHTINGMEVENVSSEERKSLERLEMVESVHPERQYEINLDTSVPLVGADELWNQQGLTGEDIEVAVIDTGVAYNHSDLGDCSTQEFLNGNCEKVVGGYDFVNEDPDPMDNNRHGTHVAGTVAGNGTTKGVAPGAEIRAFKVLGRGGFGSTGDIISGVEWAVANNSDVISMSLGGPGHPDDAMSTAVNNAADSGVLPVIAAGNSGDHETIGSPGTALKALTVGATDENDNIAGFSSLGPIYHNNTIYTKPDIVAPGVGICAPSINDGSCKSGNYESLQGTSMATPHVSGAAALLLENESLGVEELKSRLMLSANPVGEEAFTQGSGRLNVTSAEDLEFYTSPQSLNLGNTTGETVSINITFSNTGEEAKTFQLNDTGAEKYEGGSTANVFQNQTFEVSPGESKEVSADFDLTGTGGHFRGFVNVSTASSQNHLIPYAYIRTHNHSVAQLNYTGYTSSDTETVNFTLTNSSYNTTVQVYSGSSKKVVWENSSNLTGSTDLSLSSGVNDFNMSVTRHDSPIGSNTSFNITADFNAPEINSTLEPDFINPPESFANISVNYSDDRSYGAIDLMENSTGDWQTFRTSSGFYQVTCDDIWGDCSVEPAYETDNTYDSCGTGASTYESVESLEVSGISGPGDSFSIESEMDLYSVSNWQISVKTPDGWQKVKEGDGDSLEDASFTPSQEGEYIVRASASYDPIDNYCASGSYYDNDDVKVNITSSDLEARYAGQDQVENWVKVRARDQVNNTASVKHFFTKNVPPQIHNITFDSENSVYNAGETADFNVSVSDPNGDSYTVFMNYTGPENSYSREITGGNDSIQLGSTPVRGNLSVSAVDSTGSRSFNNRTVYIRENQKPLIQADVKREDTKIRGRQLNASYIAQDNFKVVNVSLYTNQTGEWKRNDTVNASENILWQNKSYTGKMKYGLLVSDYFGNTRWRNASVTFKRFEPEVDLETDVFNTLTFDEDYKIEVNRSGWNDELFTTQNYDELNLTEHESFEQNVNLYNKSFEYFDGGVNGSQAVRTGGESGAFLEMNLTSNYTAVLKYDFKTDSSARLKVDGETEKFVYGYGGWSETEVTLPAGAHTLRWEPSSEESLEIDDVEIFTFRDEYTASFQPQRIGNYTINFTSERDFNSSYVEEFFANATTTFTTTSGDVIPENHTHNVTDKINGFSKVKNVSVGINGTGNVSGYSLVKEENVDYFTGEPYNETSVVTTVDNMSYGNHTLMLNVTAERNNHTYSYETDLVVLPRMNLTTRVQDLDGAPKNATIKVAPKDGDLLQEFNVTGEESNIQPDIRNYTNYTTVFDLDNSEEKIQAYFIGVELNGSQNFTTGVLGERETSDYSFNGVRYLGYEPEANETTIQLTEKSTDLTGSKTVYTCGNYDISSEECLNSWTVTSKDADSSIALEDVEAVAYGSEKPEEPDEDDSDNEDSGSDGSSGAPSFSPPPDPDPPLNVSEVNGTTRITGLDPQEDGPVEIDRAGVKDIGFQTDVEDLEVNLAETESPEIPGKTSYRGLEINTSQEVEANMTFEVPRAWLDENQVAAQNVSLMKYEDGWQELETSIVEQLSGTVTYSAEIPGFSRFAVAGDEESGCATGEFPAVDPESQTCRVFENECRIPDSSERVESCSEWEDRQEAEQLIEEVEEQVDEEQAEERLGEAKEAVEQGNYSEAVQKATEARNIEQESRGTTSLILVATGILIIGIVGGSLLAYRAYRRKQILRKLNELSELVRLEIKKGGVDDERTVVRLLDQAESAVDAGDYSKASEKLEEVTRHL
jgi:subtilisin family serine protease